MLSSFVMGVMVATIDDVGTARGEEMMRVATNGHPEVN